MFGHHADEATMIELVTQFRVDLTGDKTAFVGDFRKLHRKSSWGVNQTGAGFVTMKNFVVRVKSLESRDLPKDMDLPLREIKVHFMLGLACLLGKFLIRDSLEESFRNVRRRNIPPLSHGLGTNQLLRIPSGSSGIRVNGGSVAVLETANCQTGANNSFGLGS